jgi:hypothetical protein
LNPKTTPKSIFFMGQDYSLGPVEVCAMDTIVNWGTFVYWVFLAVVWLVKIFRGKATVHPLLKKILASNVLMGVLVVVGMVGQGIALYVNYRGSHMVAIDDLSISAYPMESVPSQSLQVVKDQTFENESIPLDGHVYDHCTFINSCLLYDGGPYQIQHSNLRKHTRVCVRIPQLKNYSNLMDAMEMFRADVKHSSKSVMATAPR